MQEDDDEILMELKRCQSELRAVSNHNVAQLTRLLNLARDSLVRHDLKKRLRDADQKVGRTFCTSVCFLIETSQCNIPKLSVFFVYN